MFQNKQTSYNFSYIHVLECSPSRDDDIMELYVVVLLWVVVSSPWVRQVPLNCLQEIPPGQSHRLLHLYPKKPFTHPLRHPQDLHGDTQFEHSVIRKVTVALEVSLQKNPSKPGLQPSVQNWVVAEQLWLPPQFGGQSSRQSGPVYPGRQPSKQIPLVETHVPSPPQ